MQILDRSELPEKRAGRRPQWDLPMASLDDGGVVLFAMSVEEARKAVTSIRSAVRRASQDTNKKYSVYIEERGVMVWRRFELEDEEAP